MQELVIMGANNPEIVRIVHSINKFNQQQSYQIIGFIDNDETKHGKLFMGYPVLGAPNILQEKRFIKVCVANNITRDCETRKITTEQIAQYNNNFVNLVHPNVDLSDVELGVGIVIHEGCVIQPRVKIGDHCALMIRATIAHDCTIGEYCFLGPALNLCGLVSIGREVFIGSAVNILPKLKIGDYAKIAAGSVVMQDVECQSFVLGNPARKMLNVPK
jgi:sugar O-acyltransferase (sialic acid O-acetyltransferase NeuD family)